MTTGHIHFSVGNKHKKVVDIVDSKKQKGSYSDWICRAILKAYEEEQKGSKLTQYTGQQSKLPLLPPVYEVPTNADLDGLTYDEKRTIFFAAQEWVTLVRKSIEMQQKQR